MASPKSTASRLRQTRLALQFLDSQHPVYTSNFDRWMANESRYAGGDDVLDELEPFAWETDTTPSGHLAMRQNQAIYVNFPEIFCSVVAGHLLKSAPKPGAGLDFGALGQVGANKQSNTRADQVYQNPDGPGNTGSSWDLWWADTAKLAMVTGHRWIYVESPDEAPMSQADEAAGLRPYLAEFSPLDVTNWLFDQKGNLQFAIVRFWEYNPTRLFTQNINAITLTGYNYLLLVREGFTGFDPASGAINNPSIDPNGDGFDQFSAGGWWKFTPEKEVYDSGTFDDTEGQIPLFPFYYERSKGTRARPNISRSAVTELGQAAIAGMNVGSAANFNAIDVGSGLTFFLGVDEDGQDLAVGQIKRGDRWIGLPPNQDTEVTPGVATSGQNSVQSTVFDTRERAIWAAAVQLGISEATGPSTAPSAAGGPGGSGAGQQAKFGTTQGPRITKLAANLEVAQQIALDMLHLRFGLGKSTAKVVWNKKFDLVELQDRIKQFFETQRLAGISSPTLDASAVGQVAEDKGLLNDPQTKTTVQQELLKSAKTKTKLAETQAQNAKMAPPQSGSTAAKQKSRMAGAKQDKKGPGRNPGGKSNKTVV